MRALAELGSLAEGLQASSNCAGCNLHNCATVVSGMLGLEAEVADDNMALQLAKLLPNSKA